MSNTDRFLERNARYAREHAAPTGSAPKVAVVTCMDARIDAYRILGLQSGEAHVIRNAGGIVTDDVLRSLIISQRLLGTREIALIHHTECGMLTFSDDALRAELGKEVGFKPPFVLGAFSDLEDDVRESLRRVNVYPFVPHKDSVRGFVYDVTSGTLREVRG